MTWTLPEPMLAAPVSDPALLPGWAGELKWDGFRAGVSVDAGQVVLRSRRGTDMAPAFPEIRAAASAQLPEDTGLDGEPVSTGRSSLCAADRLAVSIGVRGRGAAPDRERRKHHVHLQRERVALDLLLTGRPLPAAETRRKPPAAVPADSGRIS